MGLDRATDCLPCTAVAPTDECRRKSPDLQAYVTNAPELAKPVKIPLAS